jgi:UPF0755 protein
MAYSFERFKTHKNISFAGIIALIIVLGCLLAFTYTRAPSNFPDTALIEIKSGDSLSAVAAKLADAHIIRSPFWFTNFVMVLRGERTLVGGEYYFEKPLSSFDIAKRMTKGDYHINQLKTTIPEGSTVSDISLIIKRHYPSFDTVHFVTLAQGKEGYLFPDTYYFGADVEPENVVKIMNSTFTKKISQPDIATAIATSGKTQEEAVAMASILEGEARQMQTRQIVAGILWKRISLGMPLQVDAAFRYVNGKTTEELTAADLKIDSPYNTYVNKGLPPTPISNPGLDSILAAVTPIETKYLYFLTDKNGTMHYAATLPEHAANKNKYLSN